jgi:hypothetical protein
MIGAAAVGVPSAEIGFVCGNQNYRCGDHGRESKTCAHDEDFVQVYTRAHTPYTRARTLLSGVEQLFRFLPVDDVPPSR